MEGKIPKEYDILFILKFGIEQSDVILIKTNS